MDWIIDYIWAPFVLAVAGIWRMLHRHDREIASIITAHDGLTEEVIKATEGRKVIYDQIETVRGELTEQHNTLRKEQREDFKEIRDLIVNGNK